MKINPIKDAFSWSPEQKVSYLRDIDKELLALDFKVPNRQLSFSNSHVKKIYMNSEGSRIKSLFPRIQAFWFLTVAANHLAKQRYLMYNETQGLEAIKKWNLMQRVPEEAKAP